ncbi:hypothetical protein LTR64_006030 [Lithohypha guttulata]|uniref:uncharacterized protein n=1 Tax=Lithohypha guttulata TaxID=1690604 RepID=UPI002DDF32C3|nr:hypothetical protein LTR51_002172 [Lithohypha guttulata]
MSLKPTDTDRRRWSSRDPWSPGVHPPGAYPPSPNGDRPQHSNLRSVNEVLKSRRDEYVRKKTIKIKVGTWNVAAFDKCYKDLGAWFAEGLGVKGLTQDLAGLRASTNGESDDDLYDSEIESVEEQEARYTKKDTTVPLHDSPAVPSGKEVDLYVLGLQEVIDVSSVTEAMKPYTDPNPGKKWKRALKKHLPAGYKKVVEHQLIGLLLVVFASPELAPQISSVDSTSVGTGLMGYLGNKGAVSARVLLGESTRMLFVNCHLAAGADSTALARRIWDTQQIVSRTKFEPVGDEWVGSTGRPEIIGDEDFAFWFGDLNYRLDDIPGEDVRRLLLLHARNEYDVLNASKRRIDSELGYQPQLPSDHRPDNHYDGEGIERAATQSKAAPDLDPTNDPASLQTTLKSLFTHDQLRAQQKARKAFHEGWREGDINFLPTYKYDVGSVAMFDSSEKKRSPSWCDRILYRSRRDYEQYQQRLQMEAESARRDEEMQRKGLGDASSHEDVLFDYDPDADGDSYDDDAEFQDNNRDAELVRTKSGSEDTIALEEYVSHQRVLSSDHKPLSAVFTLTYDSVDQELKAKVMRQVTKEFDKVENESRPTVTLVLDHHPFAASVTDRSADTPELKLVDFGDIRYHVQYERHLTIANTGQIEVLFAFVSGPSDNGDKLSPIPAWLDVQIHHDMNTGKAGPPDLGPVKRYRLLPGETTDIALLVEITQPGMVKHLNSGDMVLDNILVLRISNGRDYFIPVKGKWLQTCFYRSIDELVRIPSGVRSLTLHKEDAEAQRQPSKNILHSAPQELFVLTDKIPQMVERVVADWDMLHNQDEPPWNFGTTWPFLVMTDTTESSLRTEQLADIREALDTASSIDDLLSPTTDPLNQLVLLAETLVHFLQSLTDGIITNNVWKEIESRLQIHEKSKQPLSHETLQDIVMEAMSTTPIHSVSLTFITFMLNRLANEICANSAQQDRSVDPVGRSRSSTSASAMSDVSLSSIKSGGSTKTKRSLLSSLTGRSSNLDMTATSTSSTIDGAHSTSASKAQLAHKYAEVFAPLVIRSDQDHKTKEKASKAQLARKVRVLEVFLNQEM